MRLARRSGDELESSSVKAASEGQLLENETSRTASTGQFTVVTAAKVTCRTSELMGSCGRRGRRHFFTVAPQPRLGEDALGLCLSNPGPCPRKPNSRVRRHFLPPPPSFVCSKSCAAR